MERRIAEALDRHGDVPPPWARYPEIPMGSIGWRMGYGESWLDVWHAWLVRQPSDRAWRLAYLRRHAPAPRTWAYAAVETLAPDVEHDSDDLDEALVAELEAAGAIGDDVGMIAWEALHGTSPTAPWKMFSADWSLHNTVRYGARELDFWARWCASRRASGELERWLSAAPPAPNEWSALREAAARGTAPMELPADSYERVGVLLAAYGQTPAPWQLGEDPSSLRQEHEGAVSYADAWFRWAFERFDDSPTWQRYLAEQGPRSQAWSAALADALPWL